MVQSRSRSLSFEKRVAIFLKAYRGIEDAGLISAGAGGSLLNARQNGVVFI